MPVISNVGNIYPYVGSLASLQLGSLVSANVLNVAGGPLTGSFLDDDGVLDQGDDGQTTMTFGSGGARPIDYLGTGWSATAFLLGAPVLPKAVVAFAIAGQIYVYFPDGPPLLSAVSIAFNISPSATFTLRNPVIVCFCAGTRILTPRGAVAVEKLAAGDAVVTLDRGVQILRWTGQRKVTQAETAEDARLRPVQIRRGAFGPDLPARDLCMTQQHRIALRVEGEEVLIAARHLLGRPGVTLAPPGPQTYCHLLFDRHEVVLAEGCATESLFLGPMALQALDAGTLRELERLFPDRPLSQQMTETARPVLRRGPLMKLARRLGKEPVMVGIGPGWVAGKKQARQRPNVGVA